MINDLGMSCIDIQYHISSNIETEHELCILHLLILYMLDHSSTNMYEKFNNSKQNPVIKLFTPSFNQHLWIIIQIIIYPTLVNCLKYQINEELSCNYNNSTTFLFVKIVLIKYERNSTSFQTGFNIKIRAKNCTSMSINNLQQRML